MARAVKLRLLDLYCGAGGGAWGYHLAGFADITGIDTNPEPRYPFRSKMADALEYLERHLYEYDFIHASPPCQAHSVTASLHANKEALVDLIPMTRMLLIASSKPYVIENVPGAKLLSPVTLCGTMFDLHVYRHRVFETNFAVRPLPHRAHPRGKLKAGPALPPGSFITVAGSFQNVKYARYAMDIDWMKKDELGQAIPPAYTRYIGEQFFKNK